MNKFISIIGIMLWAGILSAQVGINTTDIDYSAILQIESTTKGVLFPSLTLVQRDALDAAAEFEDEIVPAGLTIYCSDCCTSGGGAIFYYNGADWKSLDGDCSEIGDFPDSICSTTTLLSQQHLVAGSIPLLFDGIVKNSPQPNDDILRFHQGSGDVIEFALNEAIPAGGKIVLYWTDTEAPTWEGLVVDLDLGVTMSQASVDTYIQAPVLPNSTNIANGGNDDFILTITLIADTDTITVSSHEDSWGEDPRLLEIKIFDDQDNEIPFTCD